MSNPEARTFGSRLLRTLGLASLAASLVGGVVTYVIRSRELGSTLRDRRTTELAVFPSLIASDSEGLARALVGLSRIEALLRPFAERRREDLLAAARPIFQELKAKNNVTHFYFIDLDGRVFLRVHKPEQSGDRLERTTFRRSAASGSFASGIEMGKNFFSLRAVRPVSFQGTPLGYVEVAEEIDHVFGLLKTITGSDVSLFLTGDYVKATGADVRKPKVGSFTILESTNEPLALALASTSVLEAGTRGQQAFDAVADGTRYSLGVGPLRDVAGAVAGVLVFQRDASDLDRAMWGSILANAAIVCGLLVACGALIHAATRQSLRSLGKAVALVDRVAEGDLTASQAVVWQAPDRETALLLRAMENMSGRLKKVLLDVRETAAAVAAASTELSERAERTSKGVAEQAERASLIASSTAEVAQSVTEIARSAAEISTSAVGAAKVASEGREVAASSIAEVNGIADRVQRGTRSLTSLVERSEQIGEVVGVIDSIASETNLLALNATIEAAHSGGHGEGFAVVAREVKVLAESTATSTQKVKQLVQSVQAEVRAVAGSMQEVQSRVDTGVEQTGRAGRALAEIAENVESLRTRVDRINVATTSVSSVSRQISGDIESIASVSRAAAETSRDVARASADLARHAERLSGAVGQFRF